MAVRKSTLRPRAASWIANLKCFVVSYTIQCDPLSFYVWVLQAYASGRPLEYREQPMPILRLLVIRWTYWWPQQICLSFSIGNGEKLRESLVMRINCFTVYKFWKYVLVCSFDFLFNFLLQRILLKVIVTLFLESLLSITLFIYNNIIRISFIQQH